MGINFWWIYDIIFLAVVIISIYNCAKKGFSDIIILIIGCVVSVFLASFISRNSSQFIYDKFIKQTSIEATEATLEKYSPALSIKEAIESQDYGAIVEEGRIKQILQSKDPIEMLYEYTNQSAGDVVDTHEGFKDTLISDFSNLFAKQLGVKLPPYVVRELTDRMKGNGELFVETTEKLLKSPENISGYIEENYIRQPALKLVRSFVFVISYFVFMLLIRAVVYSSIKLGLLNGYDRLDRIAGGVFGLIQAAVLLIITVVLIKIMIHVAESDGSLISYEAVERTKLFKYVFNFIEKY